MTGSYFSSNTTKLAVNLTHYLSSCLKTLALVLVGFIRTEVKCCLLKVSLHTLRILSRDKRVLAPLVTDSALQTLAKLAGLTTSETSDEVSDPDLDFYDSIISTLAKAKARQSHDDDSNANMETTEQDEEDFEEDAKSGDSGDVDSMSWCSSHRPSVNEMHHGSIHQKVLERGRRDRRESKMEGEDGNEEEGYSAEEAQRKEAMKVLCNIVYNSTWAQERFSALRCGT